MMAVVVLCRPAASPRLAAVGRTYIGRLCGLLGPAILCLVVVVVVPGRLALEMPRCSCPRGRRADAVEASDWAMRCGHEWCRHAATLGAGLAGACEVVFVTD